MASLNDKASTILMLGCRVRCVVVIHNPPQSRRRAAGAPGGEILVASSTAWGFSSGPVSPGPAAPLTPRHKAVMVGRRHR